MIDPCWQLPPKIFEKFELQVRSHLQEAWGEIQHTAIYKGRMPESEKDKNSRRFANAADVLLSVDGMLKQLIDDSN